MNKIINFKNLKINHLHNYQVNYNLNKFIKISKKKNNKA